MLLNPWLSYLLPAGNASHIELPALKLLQVLKVKNHVSGHTLYTRHWLVGLTVAFAQTDCTLLHTQHFLLATQNKGFFLEDSISCMGRCNKPEVCQCQAQMQLVCCAHHELLLLLPRLLHRAGLKTSRFDQVPIYCDIWMEAAGWICISTTHLTGRIPNRGVILVRSHDLWAVCKIQLTQAPVFGSHDWSMIDPGSFQLSCAYGKLEVQSTTRKSKQNLVVLFLCSLCHCVWIQL